MQEINKSFENLIRQEYLHCREKHRNGKLEFYNKGKRIATLTVSGTYSGLFRDWREGKTYSLKEYLISKKGLSQQEVRDFLKRELGSNYSKKSFENYNNQINDKRAYHKTNTPVVYNTTKFDRLSERAEKYLREVRGFKFTPQFIKDRIEYDAHYQSIVFPLYTWNEQRVTYQKLKLNEDGTKAGAKLLAKGSMHGSLWYAKGKENNNTLIIAEGVETAISIADAIACVSGVENAKEFDYCARIGTRKLTDIPEKYTTLIILVDNDKDDSPALKATEEFITELRHQGRYVIPLNAMVGEKGDFADLESYERGIQFFVGCINHIQNTNIAQNKISVNEARENLRKVFNSIFTCEENLLIKVGMGIGKTTTVIPHVIASAKIGNKMAVCFQNHSVLQQQLPFYEEEAKKHGLTVAVQKGRNQPNMCTQLDVIKDFIKVGQAPKIYCERECPDKEACEIFMYLENLKKVKEADIILTTQANLTIKQESDIRRDVIFIDEIGEGQAFIKKDKFNFTENDLDYDTLKNFKNNIPEEIRDATYAFLAVWDIIDNRIKTGKHSLIGKHVIECIIQSNKLEVENKISPYRDVIEQHRKSVQELEKNKEQNRLKLLELGKGNFEYLNKKIQKTIDIKLNAIKEIEEKINSIQTESILDVYEVVSKLEKSLTMAKRKIWTTSENVKLYPAFFQFFKKAQLLLNLVRNQLNNMEENQFIIYQEGKDTIVQYFEDIHPSWGNAKRIIMDATPQLGYERILGKNYREINIEASADYARFHYNIKSGLSKTHIDKSIQSYKQGVTEHGYSVYKACKMSRNKTTILDIANIINSHVKKDKKLGIITTKAFKDFVNSDYCKDLTIQKDNILYYGNTRSKNDLKDVDNLLLIGSSSPNCDYYVKRAELLQGEVIHDNNFSFETREVYSANGEKYTTKFMTHTNKFVEKDIQNHIVAEYSQAIERCRTVNRTADNPVDIYIYSDMYIPNYRFDTIEKMEESDDFYAQRYNEILTGGEEGIIIETGFVAWGYHGERIRGKSCYENKKFEESKHALKAIKDGYRAYILKFKEWKRRETRILVPPHMTAEQAQEYIIHALSENSKTGITDVEIIPIEIDFKVKEPKFNIYNISELCKFSYFRFLPLYNMLKDLRARASESVYLSGMEWFKLPDFVRFCPEFIKRKRDEIKECFYKTKKISDIYKNLCKNDIEKLISC